MHSYPDNYPDLDEDTNNKLIKIIGKWFNFPKTNFEIYKRHLIVEFWWSPISIDFSIDFPNSTTYIIFSENIHKLKVSKYL